MLAFGQHNKSIFIRRKIMSKMNPVVHFEMPADDSQRMADFYANAFGWQAEITGPEMGGYVLVTTTETGDNGMPKTPGAINGGFYKKSEDMPAQHPSLVIQVDDLEEAIQKVNQAGGRILNEPDDIPGVGRFVYLADTEGNVVGMLQPPAMG
jgi:uncharacterized protein